MIETVLGLLALMGMILFPAAVVLAFARYGQRPRQTGRHHHRDGTR